MILLDPVPHLETVIDLLFEKINHPGLVHDDGNLVFQVSLLNKSLFGVDLVASGRKTHNHAHVRNVFSDSPHTHVSVDRERKNKRLLSGFHVFIPF